MSDTGQSIACLLTNAYPCYGRARADDPTAVAVVPILLLGCLLLALLVVAHAVQAARQRRAR